MNFLKAKHITLHGKNFRGLLDELEKAIELRNGSMINRVYDKLERVDNANLIEDHFIKYDYLITEANKILINYKSE